MRILLILAGLVVVLSITISAQSHEKSGCAKEKECVVKTCEDSGTEAQAHVKGETTQKKTVTIQKKTEKETQQVSGTKTKAVVKEVKKK
jgi:hypothetical protein